MNYSAPRPSVPMPPMRYFFRKQPPHIAGRPSHHLPDHEAFLFPFQNFPVVSEEAYETWRQRTHEGNEQQGSDDFPDKRLQPIKDATGEEIVDPNADDLKLARLKRDIQVLDITEAMVVRSLLSQLESSDTATTDPLGHDQPTPRPVWVVFHTGDKKTTRQPPLDDLSMARREALLTTLSGAGSPVSTTAKPVAQPNMTERVLQLSHLTMPEGLSKPSYSNGRQTSPIGYAVLWNKNKLI